MAPTTDWNLRMIGAREARALLPTRADSRDIDWGDVTVTLIDTGYTRHPVFGYRDGDTPWILEDKGLNLVEGGHDAQDPVATYTGSAGHGTRVGSVLCGVATEPDGGTEIGVAPKLPVIPCRVTEWVVLDSVTDRERVAGGLRHAMSQGSAVASISLGYPVLRFGIGGLGAAVDQAYEAGLIVVAAAGQVVDSVTYPGKYNRTICAGGTNWQRRLWRDRVRDWRDIYRVGEDNVDVWAPADRVTRADALAPGVAPGADDEVTVLGGDDPVSWTRSSASISGKLGIGSGTSYATVQVAAAAAMWRRLRGDEIERAYPHGWQCVEAFRALLKATAGPVSRSGPDNGTGILDIAALLTAPLPAAATLEKATEDRNKWA